MFGGPKPTASLSSGLLARKGHARPAMRPQGFLNLTPSHPHEDLGWNDMGEDHAPEAMAPAPVPQPIVPSTPAAAPALKPPVLRQREALKEQFVQAPAPEPEPAPEPVVAQSPVAEPPVAEREVTLSTGALARVAREVCAKKSKAAFTLRLDPERHLRLRLASAVRNRSAQQIVTEALDAFLESLTEVDALAAQIQARAKQG